MGGPWDTYRCFRVKNSISDMVPANGGQEAPNGWSAQFGTYTFSPTDSDLGQGITDFGKFMAWRFVSPTWFNNGSPGNGYIHVPIAPVDAAQANKMNIKLGTSQFVTNSPTGAAWPLQNAGLTPLEGTLFTIRDYFQGGIADAARGGAIPVPPNSCGKNYSVVLTNGLPSVTRFGVPSSDVASMLARRDHGRRRHPDRWRAQLHRGFRACPSASIRRSWTPSPPPVARVVRTTRPTRPR